MIVHLVLIAHGLRSFAGVVLSRRQTLADNVLRYSLVVAHFEVGHLFRPFTQLPVESKAAGNTALDASLELRFRVEVIDHQLTLCILLSHMRAVSMDRAFKLRPHINDVGVALFRGQGIPMSVGLLPSEGWSAHGIYELVLQLTVVRAEVVDYVLVWSLALLSAESRALAPRREFGSASKSTHALALVLVDAALSSDDFHAQNR